MSWELDYEKKLRTADEALALCAIGHAGLHSARLR